MCWCCGCQNVYIQMKTLTNYISNGLVNVLEMTISKTSGFFKQHWIEISKFYRITHNTRTKCGSIQRLIRSKEKQTVSELISLLLLVAVCSKLAWCSFCLVWVDKPYSTNWTALLYRYKQVCRWIHCHFVCLLNQHYYSVAEIVFAFFFIFIKVCVYVI